MNTNDHARGEARSRANRRLRNMTIRTAFLGVAATGTLGWVAAATYDGSTTAGTTGASVTTADSGTTTATASTTTTMSTTTSSAPTVTSAPGNAHATTGGS